MQFRTETARPKNMYENYIGSVNVMLAMPTKNMYARILKGSELSQLSSFHQRTERGFQYANSQSDSDN